MSKRRKRTRVGERIEPGPTYPIDSYVQVTCPTCGHASWAHHVLGFGSAPDAPGFERSWELAPLQVVTVCKYPRNPDTGERGFSYRKSHDDVPYDLTLALHDEFEERMRAWLDAFSDEGPW